MQRQLENVFFNHLLVLYLKEICRSVDFEITDRIIGLHWGVYDV